MSACGRQAPGEAPAEVSWGVAAEPTLVIGHPSGDFAGDLDGIVDIARLSDGRIVIADGAQRLLFFGSDGSYLLTVGREGQGPGEFTGLAWIQILDADTILAYDSRQRRGALFASDGALAGTITHPASASRLVGRAPDGTLVGSQQVSPPLVPGILRPTYLLLHLNAQGEVLDTVASVPGTELFYNGIEGPNFMGAILRETHFAFGPEEILVATGDRFEVMAIGTTGAHAVRSLRSSSSDSTRLLAPADVEAALGSERWVEAIMGLLPADQRLPLTHEIVLDDVGWIWVEHYAPSDTTAHTWSALDLDSEAVVDVVLPPRFTPFQIGQDFVLGVARDTLDVEWVHMHALKREN
jgi:hypothetical protein